MIVALFLLADCVPSQITSPESIFASFGRFSLQMRRISGIDVVVSNAAPEVQVTVDAVVSRNDNGGVAGGGWRVVSGGWRVVSGGEGRARM